MSINRYRKFKRKHKVFHILLVASAVIMFWRGVWGILDMYFFPGNPLASYVSSIVVAIAILYFDDFHLKELE